MDAIRKKTAVIILAAGKGTRMKSDKAKVLHELNGKPMINYVVETASKIAGENVVVVVGHQRDLVKNVIKKGLNIKFAVQEEQKGTGHAVMCAMPKINSDIDTVIILCGDVPLITHETILTLIHKHEELKVSVTVLSVHVENATGYGRIVTGAAGDVLKIVEEADATVEEKKIKLINTGIYCVNKLFLECALLEIKNDNAQGEMYLTDIVEIAAKGGHKIGIHISPITSEVIGVNTSADLELAQEFMACRSV